MRTFEHRVMAALSGYTIRQEYRAWCEDQFGPSDVEIVYYYQDGRVGVDGNGRWLITNRGACFEFAEHAVAFKMRWG